jgi:hypothetical protein
MTLYNGERNWVAPPRDLEMVGRGATARQFPCSSGSPDALTAACRMHERNLERRAEGGAAAQAEASYEIPRFVLSDALFYDMSLV